MNTFEAIAKRKSTRSYKPVQIPEDALQAILKAGCAAPIAMARYDSLHITVVQNQALLDRFNAVVTEMLSNMTGMRSTMDYGAKTLVLVSSMTTHRPGMEYTNAGIVIENMVLAATDLGIDSVILGAPPVAVERDEALSRAFGIPEGYKPLLGVYLGYATEDAPAKEHSITINRV